MSRKAHITRSAVYEAETRLTNPNPPLYKIFLKLLKQSKTHPIEAVRGRIPMNSEEALAYWVTILQQDAAESEFGTNSDPVGEAPRLMVLGKGRSKQAFTEVDLLKDDPQKILNETWSPVELWADEDGDEGEG